MKKIIILLITSLSIFVIALVYSSLDVYADEIDYYTYTYDSGTFDYTLIGITPSGNISSVSSYGTLGINQVGLIDDLLFTRLSSYSFIGTSPSTWRLPILLTDYTNTYESTNNQIIVENMPINEIKANPTQTFIKITVVAMSVDSGFDVIRNDVLYENINTVSLQYYINITRSANYYSIYTTAYFVLEKTDHTSVILSEELGYRNLFYNPSGAGLSDSGWVNTSVNPVIHGLFKTYLFTIDDYNAGYDNGYKNGKDEGYKNGLQDNPNNNFTTLLKAIFSGVGEIFNIKLLPNISIGAIVMVPFVFGVIAFVIGRRKE